MTPWKNPGFQNVTADILFPIPNSSRLQTNKRQVRQSIQTAGVRVAGPCSINEQRKRTV